MIFILNRDYNILGIASNDTEDMLNYYNDKLHSELSSGVSTFEFTVSKNHSNASYLQEGNFITFKTKKGKQVLFTIIEMEEDRFQKSVYCEDIGLDLLNETRGPLIATSAHPISWYIEDTLLDSGWEIGINEINHLSRKLEFDSYTNALERILNILSRFDDAEVDFTVNFDGNKVVNQYINIYKRRGRTTGIRIDADFNLVEARRKVSIDSLATGLYGLGAEVKTENPDDPGVVTTFASIEYDDGRYYQWEGYIFDREANKKWSRYSGDLANRKGFIVDYYSYDTESPQELFNRTLTQLKKRCEPAVEYEAKVSSLNLDLEIGDTVTIVDSDFNPPLYLEARVLSVDESKSDNLDDTIKLGNYELLKSSIDTKVRDIQKDISSTRAAITGLALGVIVEQGTTGYGGYVKYADGAMSAWGTTYYESVAFAYPIGALWYASPLVVTFGVTFEEIQSVVAVGNGAFVQFIGGNTTSGAFHLYRPLEETVGNSGIGLQWTAWGRWKP